MPIHYARVTNNSILWILLLFPLVLSLGGTVAIALAAAPVRFRTCQTLLKIVRMDTAVAEGYAREPPVAGELSGYSLSGLCRGGDGRCESLIANPVYSIMHFNGLYSTGILVRLACRAWCQTLQQR